LDEKEAAVLVRVGVPDHHLEHAALGTHGAAHQRDLQQVAHDLGRPAQVVDGLEQRHDRSVHLNPGGVREQSRLLASRYTPRMSATSCVMLRMKLPTASLVEALPHLVNQAE